MLQLKNHCIQCVYKSVLTLQQPEYSHQLQIIPDQLAVPVDSVPLDPVPIDSHWKKMKITKVVLFYC